MTPRRLLLLPLLLVCLAGTALAQSDGASRYYEVEALNRGLPQPPADLNLETPQALMETFLAAAEQDDWERAAHTLDLSHVPVEEQALSAPLLASRLHDVIRRGMWLDWGSLPDRPDGLMANEPDKDPMSGEPRRNIRLALLELENRPVSIRVARVKPSDGDPSWVFSAQTVGNIEEMHQRFGATALERSLPAFLQQRAFLTLTWWEVIALPLLLLASVLAAAFAYRAIGGIERKWQSKTARAVLDSIRMPVALLLVVGIFTATRSMLFTFSGAVNTFLTPLQTVLFVVAIVLIGVRIVDALLDRMVRSNVEKLGGSESADERVTYTNISAARRIAIVVAFLIGVGLVLVQVHAFQSLGFSLLASAGAVGIVLAFAARTMLADIMASLQIAFAKSARIGDAVLYDGQWCYVEKVNFTYIQLQSWDGRRLIVPVNELVSKTFENWSREDASMFRTVELRLDHRTDVDRLREPFQRFVEEDDDVIKKDEAKVQVIDHDADGMVVRFYAWAGDPASGWNMHCRLREEMLKVVARLEAEQSREHGQAVYIPRERVALIGGGGHGSVG
ncbi:mechanosensitive ion channel family protein [Lutibaculum baratangense]|uniref:Potassium efflux system KefA protein n=1 Tax=Lutibaculum baratangense AMV1 TaxID=631454 RepID=V4R8U1_9HYPH|nr:mechanosensitive ion channel family protein [Lutibaculum baratangense]ESR22601.1 Potassium efflux system KefA protein [Lutibaculum baratangense AMV1]